MRTYLKKLIIAGIAFYVAYSLVPVLSLGNDYKNVLIVIGSLFLASFLAKNIFNLILIPANIITVQLVTLLMNFAVLFGFVYFLQGFKISPYDFGGFNFQGIIIQPFNFNLITTILLVAFVITLTQKVLHFIFD